MDSVSFSLNNLTIREQDIILVKDETHLIEENR
jgi:hypothetical protein